MCFLLIIIHFRDHDTNCYCQWPEGHLSYFKPSGSSSSTVNVMYCKTVLCTWHNSANTTLCSASYISCERDTARICCWEPAVQQSYDISCLPGPQQQTQCCGVHVQMTGRTDRQTDTWQFYRPCYTSYVSSANDNNNNDRLTAFDPGQPG